MSLPLVSGDTGSRNPRMLAGIVVGISAVIAVMLLAFAAPAINSGATGLPLALSGPPPALQQITTALEANAPGGFETIPFASAQEAAAAIQAREAIGGIAVTAEGITIQTAAGAGAPYLAALNGIGTALAATGQPVTFEELAPTTTDDPAGSGLVALGLPLLFGGIATGVALSLAYRGSLPTRIGAALAVAVVTGLSTTAILQYGFGSFDGSYWLTAAAVAAGIAAIGLTMLGLGRLAGAPGIGIGAILLLLVSNPLSGLATGPHWLPAPWGAIGQWLPIGAAGTAIRSAAYFEGNGATNAWIVLTLWALAGLALLTIAHRRDRASDRVTVRGDGILGPSGSSADEAGEQAAAVAGAGLGED